MSDAEPSNDPVADAGSTTPDPAPVVADVVENDGVAAEVAPAELVEDNTPSETTDAPEAAVPVVEVASDTPEAAVPVVEVASDTPEAAVPVVEVASDAPEAAVPVVEVASDAPEAAVPVVEVLEAAVPAVEVASVAPETTPRVVEVAEPAVPGTPEIGATSLSSDVAVPHNPRPVAETANLVTGVVVSVSADEVELALRDGRTAVIYRRDVDQAGTDPTTLFSVGDKADGAELRREDPKQRVVLSRTWALKQIKWNRILEAKAEGTLLEGVVTGVSGKGVVVDVGVRGFVPASHLDLNPVSDLSGYAGKTLQLKVLEVDPGRDRLVLSRRSVLMREQRKATHDALAGLEVGSVIEGTVKSLTSYGAFVDVGGINGLVHLSECSWKRLRSPAEAVTIGETVRVKVLDVKIKKRRVSLSLRQVEDDPLLRVEVGSVIEGPVARLVEFGAFVDVGDIEGLVHLTELSEYRVSVPEEVVTPGEVVRVKVLSVDRKRRRIELSIRQAVSSQY